MVQRFNTLLSWVESRLEESLERTSLDTLDIRDALGAASLNQLASIDRIAVVTAHEVLRARKGLF